MVRLREGKRREEREGRKERRREEQSKGKERKGKERFVLWSSGENLLQAGKCCAHSFTLGVIGLDVK